MTDYQDARVAVGDDVIELRGYYFPWGTKRIRDGDVVDVRRRELGALSGRYRVWGTGDPRYWFPLDPGRTSKSVAFVFDLGTRVRPVVTPDDPEDFAAALRSHGVRVLDE